MVTRKNYNKYNNSNNGITSRAIARATQLV